MLAIKDVESAQLREKLPDFQPGDQVRVTVRVIEGGKERSQPYQGVVTSRHGAGLKESFSVRRVTHGVGVERTFLLHSPRLEKIEVLRHGRVRRAKLYYLRDRIGKSARIKEDRNR